MADDAAARALRGTHLYLLLEGAGESESLLVPGRPAGRWQALQVAMPQVAALKSKQNLT